MSAKKVEKKAAPKAQKLTAAELEKLAGGDGPTRIHTALGTSV